MAGHIWTQSQAALEELLGTIEPVLGEVLVDRVDRPRRADAASCRARAIVRVLTFLRDEPGLLFKELVDLCGVDYPAREQRFDVVYHLLSLRHNQRLRVKVETDEATPVPSVIVGVPDRRLVRARGLGHVRHPVQRSIPDLRRLLTDYGFEGHPLRKDFPHDRLCRDALRRGAEARRLRAGAAAPGLAQLGFPLALGGRRRAAAGRREGAT